MQQIDREKQRFVASLRCSDVRLSVTTTFDAMKSTVFQRFLCHMQEREVALRSFGNGKNESWI